MIVKTYKESFTLRFPIKSKMAEILRSKEPKLVRKIIKHAEYPIAWEEKVIEPVVVLQLVPCGEQELQAEIIWKEKLDRIQKQQEDEG